MASFGTLLLTFAAVSFQGGNVSDLAKSISESTKQNVVFQAGQQERAPAFVYDAADLNEFARVVQKSTGFRRAPGTDHVFHHGRLPSTSFGVRAVQRVFNDQGWQQGAGIPEGALKEGKITIRHKSNEATTLNNLGTGVLTKPVEMHWALENLAVKAWVTDMPVDDFMKFVAKSVGGRILQQKDRYLLDIDAGEIQRRALTTLAEAPKQKNYAQVSPRDQMQLELSRSMLGSLNSAQVAALLATPEGSLKLEIGGGMRPVVQRYIQVLMTPQNQQQGQQGWQSQQQADQAAYELAVAEKMRAAELAGQAIEVQRAQRGDRGGEDPRGARFNANALRRMDPRILGYATIDATFRVRVEVLTLDQLGRPSRLVPLP